MLKVLTGLVFLFWIGNISAAIPTVEGLFRNAANADVQGDTIALSLIIEKMQEDNLEEDRFSRGEEIPVGPLYLKVIFSRTENEPARMIQVLYSEAAMENNQVVDVFYSQNIFEQIRLDSPLERKLLFGLLTKYGLNSSNGMNSVLQRVTPDYRLNREIISSEKRNLYNTYMQYLREAEGRREQPADEQVENPMRPEDPEERERVNEILAANFFEDLGQVTLERLQGRFYWRVALDNMSARFSHEAHRLRQMVMRTIDGEMEINIGEYVMFNGVHDLPKQINLKLANGERYRITFTAHQDFVSRNRTIQQRYQEYDRLRESNAGRLEPITSRLRQIFVY